MSALGLQSARGTAAQAQAPAALLMLAVPNTVVAVSGVKLSDLPISG